MQLTPLFDRVLITPLSSEQNFQGLIIPDTSTNLKKGKVIAAVVGKPGSPMTVKKDMIVFYKKEDGFAFTMEGEDLVILVERDIWLAV